MTDLSLNKSAIIFLSILGYLFIINLAADSSENIEFFDFQIDKNRLTSIYIYLLLFLSVQYLFYFLIKRIKNIRKILISSIGTAGIYAIFALTILFFDIAVPIGFALFVTKEINDVCKCVTFQRQEVTQYISSISGEMIEYIHDIYANILVALQTIFLNGDWFQIWIAPILAPILNLLEQILRLFFYAIYKFFLFVSWIAIKISNFLNPIEYYLLSDTKITYYYISGKFYAAVIMFIYLAASIILVYFSSKSYQTAMPFKRKKRKRMRHS